MTIAYREEGEKLYNRDCHNT